MHRADHRPHVPVAQSRVQNLSAKLFRELAIQMPGGERTASGLQGTGRPTEKKVFFPVKREKLSPEEKRNIIPSLAFVKQKYNADGSKDKVKVRLVAGGHKQDRSLFVDKNTSSPTLHLEHLFVEMAMAQAKKPFRTSLDIGAAYLNVPVEESEVNIYMRIEPKLADKLCEIDSSYSKFLEKNGSMIVQLAKSLYGCVKSALLWYKHLRSTLESLGYQANPYDECVFTKTENDQEIVVLVYVDDLMILSEAKHLTDELIEHLKFIYKEVKYREGDKHSYLGMQFSFNSDHLKISMEGYIDNILLENNVNGFRDQPPSPKLFEWNDNEPILPLSDQKRIHRVVAQLLYLSTRTRPDLALVVNYLATRVNKFTESDDDKLLYCLQYLNNTRHIGLLIRVNTVNGTKIICHADASFGIHADGKSQTARVFTLGNGCIAANTTKQKMTTRSSCESELVCGSDSASEVLGLRNYMLTRNHTEHKAILVQDNQSAATIMTNGLASVRKTKHMNLIEDGQLEVRSIGTNDMIADVLSKPLVGEQFMRLRNILLGYALHQWEGNVL